MCGATRKKTPGKSRVDEEEERAAGTLIETGGSKLHSSREPRNPEADESSHAD
jgi:hypothetical protein